MRCGRSSWIFKRKAEKASGKFKGAHSKKPIILSGPWNVRKVMKQNHKKKMQRHFKYEQGQASFDRHFCYACVCYRRDKFIHVKFLQLVSQLWTTMPISLSVLWFGDTCSIWISRAAILKENNACAKEIHVLASISNWGELYWSDPTFFP